MFAARLRGSWAARPLVVWSVSGAGDDIGLIWSALPAGAVQASWKNDNSFYTCVIEV